MLRGPAHQLAVRMRIITIRGLIRYGARYSPLGNSSLLLRCIYYAEGFAL